MGPIFSSPTKISMEFGKMTKFTKFEKFQHAFAQNATKLAETFEAPQNST
jgi:hypothetical protein